jgi:PAS domain S-box-containing protein
MKKLILKLLKKYHKQILNSWVDKLKTEQRDKLSDAQIKTFVESSLQVLMDVVENGEYSLADQYLIDAYNLFSEMKFNLLEISQVFHDGRNVLMNILQNEKFEEYDPVILLGFLDEIVEQIYARYSMLHQNAVMSELTSDRDRIANKLEMNQRYLRGIMHTAESAIVVVDENEKIRSWNIGAERLFGMTEEEVLGKPSTLLLPGDQRYVDELQMMIESARQTDEVRIVSTERKTKDGRILPVQLNVAKLPSENSEYNGRAVIIKDLSQVKQLQQQVDQSEKLAVIGQLAAGVAHEIGNPLASISSLVQVIQRKNKEEVLGEQLIIIKENIDRITKIVRELVDFSRPPSYEKVIIQITDVIKTAVGIVKYDKRVKKVNFETDFDPGLPLVRIVPDQVLQVFVNILINALDAIEGKGTITVKSYYKDEFIFIAIKDDGCGMDSDTVNQIFNPFYTTKEVGKGTGLGLSVSYSIIKKFNGEIKVESTQNEGSTFIIKLPVLDN